MVDLVVAEVLNLRRTEHQIDWAVLKGVFVRQQLVVLLYDLKHLFDGLYGTTACRGIAATRP